MVDNSGSVLKYLAGVFLGMLLTVAYVRFSFSTPTIVQVPAKIADVAVSSAAEYDLYSPEASDEVRHRALAVVVSQDPDLFVELDRAVGSPLLEEALRRKAVRAAQLLNQQISAHAMALKQPALRKALARKHGANASDDVLKRRMLAAAIADDAYLSYYLDRVYPSADRDQQCELIESIYEHHFQPQPARVASEAEASAATQR